MEGHIIRGGAVTTWEHGLCTDTHTHMQARASKKKLATSQSQRDREDVQPEETDTQHLTEMSGGPLSCFSKQGILLLSILHYGTWAEDPPIDQYGLNGGSDKVDYNPVNQTLCIKNLTDTDSGIYIANAQKIDWTDSTSSYRLKVLEAVPIPAMQVTYSNSSTGLCIITVNCSGWMKFSVCNGGQCTLYQDSLSFSEVNITVSSGNGFIQCIVNNHVSAETKSQRMEEICIGQKEGRAAASPVGTIVGG
ncbi:hypothetical protein J4Q44_G00376980, partial [Coregonus suidteri]